MNDVVEAELETWMEAKGLSGRKKDDFLDFCREELEKVESWEIVQFSQVYQKYLESYTPYKERGGR